MPTAFVKVDQFEPCGLIKFSTKLGTIIKLQVRQGSTDYWAISKLFGKKQSIILLWLIACCVQN